jgi:hypothetical protein
MVFLAAGLVFAVNGNEVGIAMAVIGVFILVSTWWQGRSSPD